METRDTEASRAIILLLISSSSSMEALSKATIRLSSNNNNHTASHLTIRTRPALRLTNKNTSNTHLKGMDNSLSTDNTRDRTDKILMRHTDTTADTPLILPNSSSNTISPRVVRTLPTTVVTKEDTRPRDMLQCQRALKAKGVWVQHCSVALLAAS
jgi:hypothetical protein